MKVKIIEKPVNSLENVRLDIDEMSKISGGRCLFFGSFKMPGGCVCDKKNFLPIGGRD